MTAVHLLEYLEIDFFSVILLLQYSTNGQYTQCLGKNGPPKQNAVKCTVYNTIQ